MKRKTAQLTATQFAKLHNVNKRTLLYYDSIGLFSPRTKGKNGYRYYDLSQSLEFEYILMLKGLDMRITEIAEYMRDPTPEKFLDIVNAKKLEIDKRIKELKQTRKVLQAKRDQITLCNNLKNLELEIDEYKKEKLLALPFKSSDDIVSSISRFEDKKQLRMGVGLMISAEKLLDGDFFNYDYIYTHALNNNLSQNIIHRPQGEYIVCYHKGEASTLSYAYQKIISFAKENNLMLVGYAYEKGLNEFVISREEDYWIKIIVKTEKRS